MKIKEKLDKFGLWVCTKISNPCYYCGDICIGSTYVGNMCDRCKDTTTTDFYAAIRLLKKGRITPQQVRKIREISREEEKNKIEETKEYFEKRIISKYDLEVKI